MAFASIFKGTIVGQSFASFGQTDFAAELKAIQEARPDVVLQFLPGSLGLNFLRAFQTARLSEKIAIVLPAARLITGWRDCRRLGSRVFVTSHWKRRFSQRGQPELCDSVQAKYNRPPTIYAMQGYDTGLAMAAAILARAARQMIRCDLRGTAQGEFPVPARRTFSFGRNQHPVQDLWLLSVKRNAQGQTQLITDSGCEAPMPIASRAMQNAE